MEDVPEEGSDRPRVIEQIVGGRVTLFCTSCGEQLMDSAAKDCERCKEQERHYKSS